MSKGGAYYNECDKDKAAWLRHLIEEGEIAKGVVDERSIQAVQPEDLQGFSQHHFFAGIGVHSYALRRAGWDDDVPIWSGSCPCGPFSIAGLKKGFNDPRHLWPEWFRLIRVCRPDRILGEQVADASAWIDLVQTDLESHGYAFGAPDLPAAGFSGAHRRQRFFFMADANNTEWWADRAPWNDGRWPQTGRVESHGHIGERGDARSLGRAFGQGLEGSDGREVGRQCQTPERASRSVGLADGESLGRWEECANAGWGVIRMRQERRPSGLGVGGSPDWLLGRDQTWRPVEPGTFPLVDEVTARMGLLRGYGDAIDAEALTQFISAYLDAVHDIF